MITKEKRSEMVRYWWAKAEESLASAIGKIRYEKPEAEHFRIPASHYCEPCA